MHVFIMGLTILICLGFGKMMEQTDRYTSCMLLTAAETIKKISGKQYVSCNALDPIEDLYEVNKRSRVVAYNRPVQSAFSTLALSKLHMLKFIAYLRKCLDHNKYICCFSDTDSCYLALAETDIDKCVQPEKRAHYEATKKDWFVTDEFSKRQPGKCQRAFSCLSIFR